MLILFLRNSLSPNQVVVIGDSKNDAKAARAAGCSLFLVPYGYNYGIPVEELKPDAVVEDLYQAVDFIA